MDIKKFFGLFVGGILMFTISSCSDPGDMIWDFSHLSVKIKVVDKSTGENLMDPKTEGNLLNNDITVNYNDMEFDIFNIDDPYDYSHYDEAAPKTRATLPINLGLRYIKGFSVFDPSTGNNDYIDWLHLEFGEFNTTHNLHQEKFVINWGDGTSNTITFDCYIDWKKKNNPKVHHNIWLDGEKQDSYVVTIYK